MKKRLLLMLVFVSLTLLAGCAHTPIPLYNMSDIGKVAAQDRKKISVIVLPERYTGHKATGNIGFYGPDIAKTIADHLEKSGLFPQARAVKDWKEANGLKGGFDAIVAVTVVYYEGDRLMDRTVQNIGFATQSLALTAAGSYKEALLLGYVTLDVKVVKADGAAIWQGEVKGRAERVGKGRMLSIPPSEIAHEALKDAVTTLVEKLKEGPL